MRSVFQVPGVQFAVANNTNYTYSGVLGLGYSYPLYNQVPDATLHDVGVGLYCRASI